MNTLETLLALSRQAGSAIMQVYQGQFDVQQKQDRTPVTAADLAAHDIIMQGLEAMHPALPIISEESELPDFAERQGWTRYWLVDPLDGTREFIKRNDEFTVNIALIEHGLPIMGVVYAPALDVCYYADSRGAYKQEGSGHPVRIQARSLQPERITIAGSRSHPGSKIQALLHNIAQRHGEPEVLAMGSSLKICLVAEGRADVYPRLGLTSEWDTAAAQCVLEQAGGLLVDRHGTRLRYNSKDTILNPEFFARGLTAHDWNQYLES